MFGYRVPQADQAMLISGGRGGELAPFKVVTGHGAFVLPVFRKVQFLTLSLFESEVEEPCVTKQGIALTVKAVIAAKVGNDTESIVNAAQRFLSDQRQMPTLTGRIFAGHLRSIIGSMTVEEIITERQKLAMEVLDGSKEEMSKMGLIVDALQIQGIDDGGLGYIRAMAAPHNARIQQQAQIAQANADQAAAEAQQQSLRQQSQYERDTAITQAGFAAETQAAQAKAAQAGPLSQAQAQQEVINAQTDLAQRQAALREKQLIAEVIKPAEADAEKLRILARAEAESTRIQAEAAASSNRVALDQALIEQLPLIVEKAAQGLSGAKVTMLNGSDGLSDVISGLAAQGVAIFDALRGEVGSEKPAQDLPSAPARKGIASKAGVDEAASGDVNRGDGKRWDRQRNDDDAE